MLNQHIHSNVFRMPTLTSGVASRRYQGPHVWELPLDALKAAPVQWHCFMHGGRLAQAYSVPASTTMLLDRLDENIATYLVCTNRPGDHLRFVRAPNPSSSFVLIQSFTELLSSWHAGQLLVHGVGAARHRWVSHLLWFRSPQSVLRPLVVAVMTH